MRAHANYAVIWSTQVAKEMQRGFLAARTHTLRSLMFRLLWPERMIDLKNVFNESHLSIENWWLRKPATPYRNRPC